MKSKTIQVHLCDYCERELPDDLLNCYRVAINLPIENGHTGDVEIIWQNLLQLCKKCGDTLFQEKP